MSCATESRLTTEAKLARGHDLEASNPSAASNTYSHYCICRLVELVCSSICSVEFILGPLHSSFSATSRISSDCNAAAHAVEHIPSGFLSSSAFLSPVPDPHDYCCTIESIFTLGNAHYHTDGAKYSSPPARCYRTRRRQALASAPPLLPRS